MHTLLTGLSFGSLLFLLIAAHALADYPLQGPFLSEAKNRNTAVGKVFWPHALFAHSMIHGGFVLLLTGSIGLAMLEVVIHAVTDWLKCEGRISLNVDQGVHICCKVLWAVAAVWNAPL
jgi:hypothetical protein